MDDVKNILEEKAQLINQTMEKYLPKKIDEKNSVKVWGETQYDLALGCINTAIVDPIWDLLDRGGKRWRPVFFLLVIEALGGDPVKYADFMIIPEIVHNGTLMVDDIEDKSVLRRGKPCTYKLFGEDIAINAGNMMYFLPLRVLADYRKRITEATLLDIYEVYAEEMINLHIGQGMDIAWHRGLCLDEVREETYLQMCAYKTGTLARMAGKMAAVLMGQEKKNIDRIGKFAETIGIAFQIQDDILNCVGEEFGAKKGSVGEDITEGKQTLMVIHALQYASGEDKKRLKEILSMHTSDIPLCKEAIALLQKYGAVQYAKEYASRLVKESWDAVASLFLPGSAKEKMRVFVAYLITRKI